ncbi:hypothetical protein [Amycolatopsis taiwanensis]|uniref:Uncharacterized protein n=1 Tax=Amycolatopsis taiwanensis TaxID=342230 RepID=A0A9W6VD52_9PSEU|nr:hypothetical protein [Amycolatopsis taiwanensis]GLY64430.1 hypothetical protein Atai01_10490 [Amycolatopsis taiwanensis]
MHPKFLPLTADAAAAAGAGAVLSSAAEADAAANVCWASLLGGCAPVKRWGLDRRLRQLSEAAGEFAGSRWWFHDGAAYRRRVTHAQGRIEEAISEGDGPEFARAFAGYDHAVASVVVAAHSRRNARIRHGHAVERTRR